MRQGVASKLTDRQRSVIERIDRRVPIKVIAQEMGVSETRINQHIRALKDIYKAGSLNELVAIYRSTQSANPKSVADFGVGPIPTESPEQAIRRTAYLRKPAGAQLAPQHRQPASFASQWMPTQLTHSDTPMGGDGPVDARAILMARIAAILIAGLIVLAALLLTHSASLIVTKAADDGAQTIDGPGGIGGFLP